MCGDPNKVFYPQRRICFASVELASANWRYDQRREKQFHDGTFENWNDERTNDFPVGHRDGLTIYVTDEDTNDDGDWLYGSSDPMSPD